MGWIADNADQLADRLADLVGVYGGGPLDGGDHPNDCPCRICFVVGWAEQIQATADKSHTARLEKVEGQLREAVELLSKAHRALGWPSLHRFLIAQQQGEAK